MGRRRLKPFIRSLIFLSLKSVQKQLVTTCLFTLSPWSSDNLVLQFLTSLHFFDNLTEDPKMFWVFYFCFFIKDWHNGDSVRPWSGKHEFNPSSSHTKDSKRVLDASLLNTHYYKVRIKNKWNNSGNGVVSSPTPRCSRSPLTTIGQITYIYVYNFFLLDFSCTQNQYNKKSE